MKTVIIGASGVIGYNLFKQLKKKNLKVIGTYFKNKKLGLVKFNILKDKITKKIKIFEEDNVIILSAYSNPNWVYKNQKISKNINITGTKRIIDELIACNCKIFFMSSIEVFDGKKGNYNEKSKPNPLNLYGKQKLFIERYLKKKVGKYCIMRTSFIVGDDPMQRCPVKLTYETLLKSNALMAKDNFFAITGITDLCNTIYKILTQKNLKKINICHLSSRKKISRTKLADFVIYFSKLKLSMSYKETLFKFIKYFEPRGRLNNLISINPIIKKFKFKNAKSIIKNKVEILDGNL